MINPGWGRNSLPMIFQTEMAECGLACLAMVAGFYGYHSDLRSLRERLGLPVSGASAKQLLQAGKALNLQGRPLRLELGDIGQLILPAVLHWDTDHFVVLRRVTRRAIVIHDPAAGVRRYSLGELDFHFTGIAIEFSPAASFVQKKPEKEYSVRDLFRLTPSFRLALYQVFVLSLILQLLSLIFPLYLQLVIDQGLSKGDRDIVLLVALLFSLVILAKSGVSYFRGVVLLQFANQLGFQLVSTTFAHLLRLPLSFFERREMGDIVSRFSSIDNIKQLLTQEMITLIVDGIFSVLTFALLFLYSPLLAFVALLFVTVLVLTRLITIPAERTHRQEVLQAGAKQQTRFMESIRCIAVTKNYGIESDRLSEWQNYYASFVNTSYRLGHLQLRVSTLQNTLTGIDHVVIVYLGSMAIFGGQMTIGQLMSFVFLKQHFTGSIAAMLPKLTEVRMLRLELDRVSDIAFAEPESDTETTALFEPRFSGAVETEELGFSYSPLYPMLFQKLSLRLEAGEFLAISGESGCGKSTLLKLLIGLCQPAQGRVLVDGVPLSAFGVKQYRAQLSSVLHGDNLLAGSLAYNIHLGLEPFDLDRLERACRLACVIEDIDRLPMRFNTHASEMGAALSAGQIQRVLLARALYRSPKVLVLDEALSHLDSAAARRIIANLRRRQTTLILVTHNPEIVEMADYSLVLGGDEHTMTARAKRPRPEEGDNDN